MLRTFFLLTMALWPASLVAQGASQVCADFARQVTGLDSVEVEKLSYETKERIRDRRTCQLSFPWPEGDFLYDDEYGRKEVSPERMRGISNDLKAIIASYQASGSFEKWYLRNIGKSSPWSVFVAEVLDEGRVPRLLERYADYLVIRRLYEEERFEEVVVEADRLLASWGGSVVRENPDSLEEVTYFKEQRLFNLVFLYRYWSSAILGPQDLESGYQALQEFLASRAKIPWELEILGDPVYDMFMNVNCEDALFESGW